MIRNVSVLLGIVLIALAGTPAGAEARMEREIALGKGGRFVLDTDEGSVHVTGTSRSNALVRIVSTRGDDIEEHFDVNFEERPGEALVTVERKGKSRWFNFGRGHGMRFEVELPESSAIDIDTSGGGIEVESLHGPVRLDTSGGAIRAEGIGGDVDADTSGGSIDLARIEGNVRADTSGGGIDIRDVHGSVDADTSGGSIEISDVDGDVTASSSGGGIRVAAVGGRVRADTSGGPVSVVFGTGNARGGDLSSSGGGVEVELDPSVGLEIDASSSGGSVVSDLPVKVQGEISRDRLRGTLGSGGELLKLRTSGGGIRIRPL